MTSSQTALADQMCEHLRAALSPSQVQVLDESWRHEGHAGANGTGFGTHFLVRIAAPGFEKLSRVAQHRQVYAALAPFFSQGVHAVAIDIL